jgi:hypothetical protein
MKYPCTWRQVLWALCWLIMLIQFLSFLYKVLHVRHQYYLFSLFRFASSTRTSRESKKPDLWLLQWSLSQWIGTIVMVWSQCGRAAKPYSGFQRFEKVFFFNHTFYKYIFLSFRSFLILIIVESTEVLIYCAIVYKGGLALNSILWINDIHTYTSAIQIKI